MYYNRYLFEMCTTIGIRLKYVLQWVFIWNVYYNRYILKICTTIGIYLKYKVLYVFV